MIKKVYTLVYRRNTFLKQICRKKECKWYELKLEVFYVALHECVLNYKNALAAAKTYSSCLISNNTHNPKFLFDAVA